MTKKDKIIAAMQRRIAALEAENAALQLEIDALTAAAVKAQDEALKNG